MRVRSIGSACAHRPGRARRPSGRGSWLAAGKRTLGEFKRDFLPDRAAALTYYGVLSIFPALLVLVSLLGLAGQSATQPLITKLSNAAPGAVRAIVTHAVTHLQHNHGAAGAVEQDRARERSP